jgi:hypothetical protein
MTWTYSIPTEEGWYWRIYRDQEPEIVRLIKEGDDKLLLFVGKGTPRQLDREREAIWRKIELDIVQ